VTAVRNAGAAGGTASPGCGVTAAALAPGPAAA
jgi:hypothetical protein